MKTKISIMLIFVFIFTAVLAINTSLASNKDLTTSAVLISDNELEKEFIENVASKLHDEEFLEVNRIGKRGLIEVGKKIELKGVKSQKDIAVSAVEDAEAILINYTLFSNQQVIDYARQQVEAGKVIYFYGKNIDTVQFAKQFNLQDILKSGADKKKTPYSPDLKAKESTADSAQYELTFVGVEKEKWGYTLITGL